MVSQSHPLLRHLGSAESDRELLACFVESGDNDAFAALVDRHGPLVRSVCRRVLGDADRADDAFQATFLLLARKASTLTNADAVANWLFGVARRVSLAARRSSQRTSAAPLNPELDPPAPEARTEQEELLRILDEELARLPDRLRAPLVACYLEGQTQDEAARSLGWSLSTLRRRLEEGRELLRSRLSTRGASLPDGLVAGVLVPAAQVAVPAPLRATLLTLVAGAPVPASVGSLLTVVGSSSWLLKGLAAFAGVTLLLGVAYGTGLLGGRALEQVSPAPAPAVAPAPDRMADAWVEPLPTGAVARLGTTAFRPGTGGLTPGFPLAMGIHQVTFQPDGTLVSLTGQRVRFWNPTTGEELFRKEQVSTDRCQLRNAPLFDEGRHLLLTASLIGPPAQGPSALYNLQERRFSRSIMFQKHPKAQADFQGPTAAAAGGKAYAQQDFQGNAWFWDANGKPLGSLQAAPPFALFLLPDGKSALTVESRTRISLWDITPSEATTSNIDRRAARKTFGGNLSIALTSAVSPEGTWLATLGMDKDRTPDGFVRLWQTASGTPVRELPWPGLPARSPAAPALTFSAGGTVLVGVAADDNDLHFCRWQLPDGEPFTWRVSQRGKLPQAFAVDTAGTRVAIASEGTLRVFDGMTGREIGPANAHASRIQAVRFTRDGETVISVDETGEIRTWDSAGTLKGCEQGRVTTSQDVVPVLEPDQVVLRPGKRDESRIDLDVAALLKGKGVKVETLTPQCFALSPDGRALALGFRIKPPTGEEMGRVAVFDLEQKSLRWSLTFGGSAPATLCFSPDSTRLAIGTLEVILVNAADGLPRAKSFRGGHRGLVTALAFRPDGLRLASGSTDSSILLWDCRP
jgi:RNA polymerase sigma factor (sigma-70 family)